MNLTHIFDGQPFLQIAAFIAIVFGGGGSLIGFGAVLVGRREQRRRSQTVARQLDAQRAS